MAIFLLVGVVVGLSILTIPILWIVTLALKRGVTQIEHRLAEVDRNAKSVSALEQRVQVLEGRLETVGRATIPVPAPPVEAPVTVIAASAVTPEPQPFP